MWWKLLIMYERLSHHCVGMRIMFSPVGWCEAAVGAEAPGPSSCCSELPSSCSKLPPSPPSCSCWQLCAVGGCSQLPWPRYCCTLSCSCCSTHTTHIQHRTLGGNFASLETFGKSSILITFELCKWYSAGKVFWTPCSTWSDVVVAPNTKTPDFYRWLDLRRCSLVLVLVRGRNLNIPSGSHLRLTYNTKLSTIHVSAFHKTSFIFFSI